MGKTNSNRILILATALVVFFSTVVLVSAQDPRYIGGAGITVFADSDFRGAAQTFQYDVPDLRSSGLDNRISSLRIGPGEQWEVCEERNYGGRCIVVSGQESDLRRNGWGDRISSFRRTGGGGGWNPGNPGGGQMTPPPSWARGTFYGYVNGAPIQLTLANNGQVTAVTNGQTYYGRYFRNEIHLNNDRSTISRIGNGIRTYNRNTNQTTDYSRNNSGWNPGNPGWGGGQTSPPPSWARGTFYSTDGSNISMTIESDGRISLFNGGQTYYGTYYNGVMTLNNDTSDIRQIRNGIQTYNRSTGQTTNYRKR